MTGEVATSSLPAPKVADPVEAPFQRIVCGIDGSRSSHEGARQAAALASPSTLIELIAVADEWGVGLNAAAVLTRSHARKALDEVGRELRSYGLRVETRVVAGRPPWEVLLREASGRDLLVVARHSRSRFSGLAVGSTASNLLHRSHMPLLVAVAPPKGRRFPSRILVAADGPGRPERAVRMAGKVARHCGSEITMLRLDWSRRAKRPELANAVAELDALGVESVEVMMGGLPRRAIPDFATREEASLIVLGSRGLTGPRAINSVSERVAHEASCSVLVLRPPV